MGGGDPRAVAVGRRVPAPAGGRHDLAVDARDHVLIADLDHVRPLSHEKCHAPGLEPCVRSLPAGWACRPPSSGTANGVKRELPGQRVAEDMCEWFDSVQGLEPPRFDRTGEAMEPWGYLLARRLGYR